jgi:hypothetical protein
VKRRVILAVMLAAVAMPYRAAAQTCPVNIPHLNGT